MLRSLCSHFELHDGPCGAYSFVRVFAGLAAAWAPNVSTVLQKQLSLQSGGMAAQRYMPGGDLLALVGSPIGVSEGPLR